LLDCSSYILLNQVLNFVRSTGRIYEHIHKDKPNQEKEKLLRCDMRHSPEFEQVFT